MTITRLVTLGVMALAVVPLGGRWVPPFDSFAIVAPYLGVALLILAMLLWRRAKGVSLGSALCGVIGIAPAVLSALPSATPAGTPIYVLQHNMHFSNDGADLGGHLPGFDIATLQEVHAAGRALADLPAGWNAATCPRPREVSTAVTTRLPVLETGCLSGGEAWAIVDTRHGPLTVVSLHLYWPWPAGPQAAQVGQLVPQLQGLPRPILIGGDLNQMPWSGTAGKLASASDTGIAGGIRTTFHMAGGLIRLPIDHLFLPDGWGASVARSDLYGSDHHSLSATIGPTGQ